VPGWSLGGESQRPKRRVIPFGADPMATAETATRALGYYDAYAYVWDGDGQGAVVCCVRRGHDRADAEFLLPGRQLVIGCDGGWRIEAAPDAAEVA
jgi:hypothetical protein